MNLPGPITFRISEGDHYALYGLMFRRTWARCLLLGVPSAALIAVPIAWIEGSFAIGIGLILVGLLAGSVVLFVSRLFLKMRARKVYRETASLREEMSLTFEDEGLRIEQISGLWRVQWRQLVRWDEDSDIFAVFPNRMMAIIIPKQQVSKEIVDTMREQLRRSGLTRPWKLRK